MGDKGRSVKRPANPTPAITKEQRRVEGEERNAEWRTLSPAQQLSYLDSMLGNGVGAKRQRAKLAK